MKTINILSLMIFALSLATSLFGENPRPSCPAGYRYDEGFCTGDYKPVIDPTCPAGYKLKITELRPRMYDYENVPRKSVECIKN